VHRQADTDRQTHVQSCRQTHRRVGTHTATQKGEARSSKRGGGGRGSRESRESQRVDRLQRYRCKETDGRGSIKTVPRVVVGVRVETIGRHAEG
jgi:hypothetical protein